MKGLVCRSLGKSFPGVCALKDVDLVVPRGSAVALVGENGAGKSTLAKIISGVFQPDKGSMNLNDAPYAPSSPADAISSRVAMIHQEGSLLAELSVAENMFLGRLPVARGLVDYGSLLESAREHLERVGASVDPRRPVRELSVAARQQVEIAKALSQQAQLMILDEPTAALGGDEAQRLFEVIDGLKARGVGFLYISHRLQEISRVADAVVALRDGERVADWDHSDVPLAELIEAMVGRPVDAVFPEPPPPGEEELLRVEGLGRSGAFEGVDFVLHRGEILGLAGLVGAGRTELVRSLFGAEPPDRGRIFVGGRAVRLRDPRDAVEHGIVLVPEDRKEQGLVLDMTLADNLALPSLRLLLDGPFLRPARLERSARTMIDRLQIRGRTDQRASTLSGGNQQKAVIGKWLARSPHIVMLDEPTRGIDVGAKAAIYDLIVKLAEDGNGVIIVSSDLPEVLGLSHRVLVMGRGHQRALLDRAEATEETVMAKAVGE